MSWKSDIDAGFAAQTADQGSWKSDLDRGFMRETLLSIAAEVPHNDELGSMLAVDEIPESPQYMTEKLHERNTGTLMLAEAFDFEPRTAGAVYDGVTAGLKNKPGELMQRMDGVRKEVRNKLLTGAGIQPRLWDLAGKYADKIDQVEDFERMLAAVEPGDRDAFLSHLAERMLPMEAQVWGRKIRELRAQGIEPGEILAQMMPQMAKRKMDILVGRGEVVEAEPYDAAEVEAVRMNDMMTVWGRFMSARKQSSALMEGISKGVYRGGDALRMAEQSAIKGQAYKELIETYGLTAEQIDAAIATDAGIRENIAKLNGIPPETFPLDSVPLPTHEIRRTRMGGDMVEGRFPISPEKLEAARQTRVALKRQWANQRQFYETLRDEYGLSDETIGSLIDGKPQAYQDFVYEFAKASTQSGAKAISALAGTIARMSESTPWGPTKYGSDLEALADYMYEVSQQPALQPSVAEGREKLGQFVAQSVGQAWPYMLASAAAYQIGGPAAAFGVGYSIEGEDAYRETLQRGGTEEQAELNRFIVGSANALVETYQAAGILNFATGTGRELATDIARKSANRMVLAGRWTAAAARVALAEGTEEAIQEAITIGAIAPIDDTVLDEAPGRVLASFAGGAIAGLGFAGGGAIIEGSKAAGQITLKDLEPVAAKIAAERQQAVEPAGKKGETDTAAKMPTVTELVDEFSAKTFVRDAAMMAKSPVIQFPGEGIETVEELQNRLDDLRQRHAIYYREWESVPANWQDKSGWVDEINAVREEIDAITGVLDPADGVPFVPPAIAAAEQVKQGKPVDATALRMPEAVVYVDGEPIPARTLLRKKADMEADAELRQRAGMLARPVQGGHEQTEPMRSAAQMKQQFEMRSRQRVETPVGAPVEIPAAPPTQPTAAVVEPAAPVVAATETKPDFQTYKRTKGQSPKATPNAPKQAAPTKPAAEQPPAKRTVVDRLTEIGQDEITLRILKKDRPAGTEPGDAEKYFEEHIKLLKSSNLTDEEIAAREYELKVQYMPPLASDYRRSIQKEIRRQGNEVRAQRAKQKQAKAISEAEERVRRRDAEAEMNALDAERRAAARMQYGEPAKTEPAPVQSPPVTEIEAPEPHAQAESAREGEAQGTQKQPWEMTGREAAENIRPPDNAKGIEGFVSRLRGPVDKLWSRKKSADIAKRLIDAGWTVTNPQEAQNTESVYFGAESTDGRVIGIRVSGHSSGGPLPNQGLRGKGSEINVARTTSVDAVIRAVENRAVKPTYAAHQEDIQIALSEGKPVPRAVLEEYKGQSWADEALAKMGATTAQQEPGGGGGILETMPYRQLQAYAKELGVKSGGNRGAIIQRIQAAQESGQTQGPVTKVAVPAVEKMRYTSVPDAWVGLKTLYDWGQKGIRSPGNQQIEGGQGQRARKTFAWKSEFREAAVRLPKETMDAFRARTDEIWKVVTRKGEDFYLVPKAVYEAVEKELGPDAFRQRPKPQRSPRQMLNDMVNAGVRRDMHPGEIGLELLNLAGEFGITEAELNDRQKEYVAEYRKHEQEIGPVQSSFPSGVEEAIYADDDAEERAAIQSEASFEIEGNIGDFLEGLEEPTTPNPNRLISDESYKKAIDDLTDTNTLSMGIDPGKFVSLVKVGLYWLERGYRSFGPWMQKMLSALGPRFKAWMPMTWRELHPQIKKQTAEDYRYSDEAVDAMLKRGQEPSLFGPVKRAGASLLKAADDTALMGIVDQLNRIAPFLARRARRFVYDWIGRVHTDMDVVRPFLRAVKKAKLGKDVHQRLTLLLNNGDLEHAGDYLEGAGVDRKLFDAVRAMLEEVRGRANNVGMDVGQLLQIGPNGDVKSGFYWPRWLRDSEGFLQFFYGTDDWSPIEEAIKRREKATQREMTDDEKERLINSMLRGYQVSGLSLSKPGHAKARTVGEVGGELLGFYADWRDALVHYVHTMEHGIATREFFGRQTKELVRLKARHSTLMTQLVKLTRRQYKPNWTEDIYEKHISERAAEFREISAKILEAEKAWTESVDSKTGVVGRFVRQLIDNRQWDPENSIAPSEEKQLQKLMGGLFDAKSPGPWANFFSRLTYLTTLSSPLNTLTQLQEIGLAFYLDPKRAGGSLLRVLRGQARLTPDDVAITRPGEEFSTAALGKSVDRVMHLIGFNAVDMIIGKGTLIETTLTRYQALAQKEKRPADFQRRLEKWFGAAEVEAVIEDLRSGAITDRVKFLIFNQVADIQPIALTEVPLNYARGGNARIFYIFKTFQLKQLRFFINETFALMKSKKTAAEGVRNLILLGLMLQAFGLPVEAFKEWIRGRDFDLADEVMDKYLQYLFFSRWQMQRARSEGLGTEIERIAFPPMKWMDVWAREGQWVRIIPVGGELYYWLVGEGSKKD